MTNGNQLIISWHDRRVLLELAPYAAYIIDGIQKKFGNFCLRPLAFAFMIGYNIGKGA